MTWKAAVAGLFLTTCVATAAPAPESGTTTDPLHMVSPTGDTKGAVSRQQFEARVEATAADIQKRVPGVKADRYTEFDLAWPGDADEWRKLHGHAVLVIAAFSQNGSELPLARLYLVRADGSQVALRRIGGTRRQLPQDSKSGAVFGPNVSEEFYLLPAVFLDVHTQLQCDFAKNRRGFVVSKDFSSRPAFGHVKVAAGPPPLPAIKALVEREYPGFGVVIMGGAK